MTADITTIDIDSNGVATLWLNRPERHNAFDDAMIAALRADIKRLESDGAVRVIVLAGRGTSFCAGADLNWMKRAAEYSETANIRDAEAMAEMLRAIYDCAKPTIAAVHGNAFGGGVGLMACCDSVIAVETAIFAFTEVKFGIVPSTIGPYSLAAVGVRNAKRYFVTGENFSAAEAQRIGLVHQVCAKDELGAAVGKLTDQLLIGGPLAQIAVKQLIRAIQGRPIDAALSAETAKRIAAIRATPEAREGFAAFVEKRKANWRP